MHHAVGLGLIVAMIAFAFGQRTAQVVVGAFLIGAGLAFLYVAVLIVKGDI